MKILENLFEKHTGEKVINIVELPSSGSNRRYFRITGDKTVLIGALGTSMDENKAFYTIAKHFKSKGLNVPEVYAHDDDFTCYIQEDLGDNILFGAIEKGRERGKYDDNEKSLQIGRAHV